MDPQALATALPDTPDPARVRRAPRAVAIDRRANLTLLALVGAAMVLQFVAWPFLLRHWGMAALGLAVPLVVLAPTHWGLIHEAIHGQLLPQRRRNEALGRLLAIAYLLPFDAVRFGHLMHHRFTREPYDQPDVYDGATPRAYARAGYTLRLLGGLYLAEMALPLLSFLPARWTCRLVASQIGHAGPAGDDVQRLFVGFAGNPERRGRIRRDWLLSIVLHGGAFYLYGAWWPALAVTMYLRGVWLSMADNLPHYDVSLDTPQRARNFRVPAVWQGVLMNHHLHQLHHRHPTMPWTALPALARELDAMSGLASSSPIEDEAYFSAALRQFRRFGRVR
ncbi:fatty acid desaturase [Paraburkholderia sp. BL21I4N1]|uniref:fatty acid desaturase family protein n=1 Tax=Paraburkholderia sp. BL21I4N1 TaxID=1938801 RepID=UPI000D479BA8|nr:fatty acid desaturase [Paraburkholderia sp. BL21I4N1]PQV54701.1 fatty acid desaturase [Paraburkholderia sp. BL21I4N1]